MTRLFIQIWRDRSAYPKTRKNRDLDHPIIIHAFSMKEAVSEIGRYRKAMADPDNIMPFMRADIFNYAEWAADCYSAKPFKVIT